MRGRQVKSRDCALASDLVRAGFATTNCKRSYSFYPQSRFPDHSAESLEGCIDPTRGNGVFRRTSKTLTPWLAAPRIEPWTHGQEWEQTFSALGYSATNLALGAKNVRREARGTCPTKNTYLESITIDDYAFQFKA